MSGCGDCGSQEFAENLRADGRFHRVLWVALAANLLMFVVEIVASHLGRSASLQADAMDFMGDSASYAISLFVLSMGIRARATAALLKGATMGVFGLWVIGSAAWRAIAGTVPDPALMGPVALIALVTNLGVAFLLYRYRQGDSNMRSIWLCSRNDAVANIGVMLAAAGVLATGSGWPDILVAIVIAALNLSAALHVTRQATGELRATRSLQRG